MINHVKKLLMLFIGFFGFISFVSADLTVVDYGSVGNLSSVSSDWNFSYDTYNFYNATSSSNSYSRIWWQSDSFLHFNKRNYSSSSYIKGKITGFFVCPFVTGYANVYLKNIDGCEYYFGFGSDFMNLIQNTDKWAYFYNSNSNNSRTILCGVNTTSNEMICVDYSYYDNEGSGKMSDSDISAVSVSNPNRATSSPGNNNNVIGNPDFEEGYNYTPIDSGDIVFYFENNPYYKFDENVCYVGVDSSDFDILYNTGENIAFMKGTDYGNIFDLFSYFFGNSFTIKNVGSFINAWDLNYDEYYNYAEYGYNSYYSLGSGFYQEFGENLQNPFIGNSIGLFFMGFNVNKYGRYNTIGEEIATYCYYKLGLDEDSSYNITDNSDSSYRNNAGGFIDNRNRSHVYYSGSDSIVSQSWDGSVLDYFSGEDNLDFSNFFSKSFNRFKNVVVLNDNNLSSTGIIPVYILFFLIGIILFRFLSR